LLGKRLHLAAGDESGGMDMIKRIGHLALKVKDMEQSIHFYCNILGFQRAFELRDKEGRPWIEYIKVCEGQFIELFYGGENKPAPVANEIGFNHLCLEVHDIHEIAAHLKANGVTLDVEPKQGMDTNYQCWAKDPDGNRIEFMQLMPGSPQLGG
jgi:lactoylglutathione lyase